MITVFRDAPEQNKELEKGGTTDAQRLCLRAVGEPKVRVRLILPTKDKSRSKKTSAFWQGQKDSNPRPMVLETSTLPTELYPCLLVRETGIEPVR